ncbi:MAG: alpha/beta fold hydrolase [Chitinophagaceae bacterium]|nr:alpha/beta fold hydrolase [Chitinophagaceae bacterium]
MNKTNCNNRGLVCAMLAGALGIVLFLPALSVGNIQERTDSLPRPGLFSYTDKNGSIKPVHTVREWQLRRGQILDSMQAAMGKLPARDQLPLPDMQILDSVTTKYYVRYNIRFAVAAGETLPAFLYVPVQTGKMKKLPAMLALHSTGELGKKIADGQGGLQNRAYARELAERGYVVIAPDYPGFGDLKAYDFKTGRYQSGTMKSIFDNMRCVDLLQSRPDVDPGRIGVIGHSLGGHNAIFTAAFDTRLKVIVSSCGWTLMHDYFNGDAAAAQKYGGKLWPWAQDRYMPLLRNKYSLDPDKVPFDFDEVIAALAPRAFFSNSPVNDANFNVEGIKKGIAGITAVYDFMKVPGNLQVCYPDSEHDFPLRVRWQAYHFIDSVFGLARDRKARYSYADNPHYFKRMQLFATQKEQKNIVMLGNSLTEGGDWETILKRTDVANRGIGSDVTEGYINRINDVFELKPKICFIEGGVNDLARGIPQYIIIGNLATLVDTLRGKGIIPVLHAVTCVAAHYRAIDPGTFNSSIKKLNRAIEALAIEKKVMWIDLNGKITDGEYLMKQYAIEDGIHYTAETYSLWEKEIAKISGRLNF